MLTIGLQCYGTQRRIASPESSFRPPTNRGAEAPFQPSSHHVSSLEVVAVASHTSAVPSSTRPGVQWPTSPHSAGHNGSAHCTRSACTVDSSTTSAALEARTRTAGSARQTSRPPRFTSSTG